MNPVDALPGSPSTEDQRLRRNVVRLEESRQEVDRLQEELGEWLTERTNRDELGRYRTQLKALHDVVVEVLSRIRDDLAATPTDGPAGALHELCRRNDRRTILVRR